MCVHVCVWGFTEGENTIFFISWKQCQPFCVLLFCRLSIDQKVCVKWNWQSSSWPLSILWFAFMSNWIFRPRKKSNKPYLYWIRLEGSVINVAKWKPYAFWCFSHVWKPFKAFSYYEVHNLTFIQHWIIWNNDRDVNKSQKMKTILRSKLKKKFLHYKW